MRFGLIGTGRITDWVLRGARLDKRFEAVAVCSRSEDKARAFALAHDIPLAFDSIDEMLSRQDIDAVYIGTPNSTHAEIAIRCLNHGKHVICEKPMASDAHEVRAMAQAAKDNGVVLMEAMISTLNPNFVKARTMLKEIAPVRKYHASFCQYSSKYAILQEAIATVDASKVPSSFNPIMSGGALMDIGIYTIYPMVALFGRPSSIKSNLVTIDVPVPGGGTLPVDIQGDVLFSYPGLDATVSYSKVVDSFLPTEISGENGNLILDKIHICRKLDFIPHGAPTSGRGKDMEAMDISAQPFEDEYTAEFTEFIDLVEGKEETANSLENSIIVAEIMDEIRSSYCPPSLSK